MLGPMMGHGPAVQNKQAHIALLITGVAMLASGIALAFIHHPAAAQLAGVCMSLGTPILLMGIMMTTMRKSREEGT